MTEKLSKKIVRNYRNGHIFVPIMVLGLIIYTFIFSRGLDKQAEKLAKEKQKEYEQSEKLLSLRWNKERKVTFGPSFEGNPKNSLR